jgi:hypothetical protein
MENDARDPTPVLDGPRGRNLLVHLVAGFRHQPKREEAMRAPNLKTRRS